MTNRALFFVMLFVFILSACAHSSVQKTVPPTAASSITKATSVRTPRATPLDTNIPSPTAAVLVFAWHHKGAMHEPGSLVSQDLGLYDSRNSSVHTDHISKWKASRINLVLLSWWGLAPSTFNQDIHEAVQGYASALRNAELPWAIFWEATRPQDLEETLALFSEWAAQPYYAHIEGKPLLFVYNRVYDTYPLNNPLWSKLLANYHIVFDKVIERAILDLPDGSGFTYWDVPFTSEVDLKRKYGLAADNDRITRWFFINHGFDNRGLFQPNVSTCPNEGVIWPSPNGSSPDWLRKQFDLAMSYAPTGIIFPWNEMGEHSAFEPTDPSIGNACGGRGYSRVYYDLMAELIFMAQSR